MQGHEVDAFFLGVLYLFKSGWHLCLRTAINQCYLGSQTLGGAAAIHRSVSSTYYHHLLTQVDRGVGMRVGCIHQVHTGKILVG